MEKEFLYGWFGFTPKAIQKLSKPVWLLVFMCFANIFQSMLVNGLIGVILTSLETRFKFSSSTSSWIASAYDISTVPMLILVSYFGSRSHRMRWTTMGLMTVIIGAVVFVLPHFTTSVYEPVDDIDNGMCMSNRTNICAETVSDSSLENYLWVFIGARVLHGIGAVPLYTIAVTYLDDVVSKETFSFFIAIFYAAGVIGPALGYVVGGYLLSIYTDFADVDAAALGITEEDPRWVGAWWLAFIIGAVLLLVFTIPVSGYPKDLPGAATIRAAKVSEAYSKKPDDSDDEMDDNTGEGEQEVSIKQLPYYFKTLLLNPTYVGLSLMTACDSLLIGGFTAFGPKYLESQFAVTSSLAGILFGILVIPGGAGGTVFGGFIIKHFKMRCARIMKWEAIFTLGIMLTVVVLFVTCDEIKFAGINQNYVGETLPPDAQLISTCNNNCTCDNVRFQPICSYENIQYYSPCHAGCNHSVIDSGITEYNNCSCILLPSDQEGPAATNELCSSPSCELMPLWMAVFFVSMFLLFACSGMNISATVRCVPSSHRSLAIGIQWIVLRCLGTIPGPILFGASFDGACSYFEETCGNKGACLFYDNAKMALYLFIVCVATKGLSLIFVLFAYKMYKAPKSSKIKELESKISYVTENGHVTQNGHVNEALSTDGINPSISSEDITKF